MPKPARLLLRAATGALLILASATLAACRTGASSGARGGGAVAPAQASPEPAAPAADVQQRDDLSALDESSGLDDYRAVAAAANPGVWAAYERWQAARERPAQAGALPDPMLSYRYAIMRPQTRTGPLRQGLEVMQTLPWPGRLRLRREAANAEAEVARAAYHQQVAEVLREVDEAWYDAYFLERSIEVVRRNRELLALLEEVLRRRYASGEAEFADLIRAQLELGTLDDRLRTLTDQRRPVAARLNAALDRPAAAPLARPRTLVERSLEVSDARLSAWVQAESPELAALDREVEREAASAELARLEARPDLTFGVEWMDIGPAVTPGVEGSGEDDWIVSLSLNLPVWGGRVGAARDEARARRRAAVLSRELATRRLETETEATLYDLRDAERRVVLYRDTLLPRARQSFEAQEVAFRGGRAAWLDLLDAERTLLEFELALERARTDVAQAHSRLERLAGRPLSTLDDTYEAADEDPR